MVKQISFKTLAISFVEHYFFLLYQNVQAATFHWMKLNGDHGF